MRVEKDELKRVLSVFLDDLINGRDLLDKLSTQCVNTKTGSCFAGGKRFEMSARHLLSAGLILAPSTGVVGDVIVKYAGDRFLNKRNTALAPPFTTVDIGMGYRLARCELNRFDERCLPPPTSWLAAC